MSNRLSKEEFINILEEVKSIYKYQDDLNNFFRKHNVDGSIYQPNCATTTLRVLHILFGDADIDDLISKFCIDLNFGKKWKPGCVRDVNGQDIDLSSAEALYDHLKAVI